jgi:hypothetical protein
LQEDIMSDEREKIGSGSADGVALSSEQSSRLLRPASDRLPALFIAHGAPPLLDDEGWVRELGSWAGELARPNSVLMLSAHWEERPLTIGATRTLPLIYDFSGFAPHHYQQKYPAPGAPALAQRVRELVSGAQKVADDSERGLDHGAYVPLVAMYPRADVAVLQVSLPSENPVELFELGRALRPLRDEGVLIVGSLQNAIFHAEGIAIVLAKREPGDLWGPAVEVLAVEQLNPFLAVRVVLSEGGGAEKNKRCGEAKEAHRRLTFF